MKNAINNGASRASERGLLSSDDILSHLIDALLTPEGVAVGGGDFGMAAVACKVTHHGDNFFCVTRTFRRTFFNEFLSFLTKTATQSYVIEGVEDDGYA